jgi:hypothetical protein
VILIIIPITRLSPLNIENTSGCDTMRNVFNTFFNSHLEMTLKKILNVLNTFSAEKLYFIFFLNENLVTPYSWTSI